MTYEASAALAFGCLAIYVLASLGLVPFVAIEKRRSGFRWMLTSLLCSPLLALVALAAVPVGDAGDPSSPFEAELRSR
jgi:hypothetical protein